jgi:type III secretion protein L
VTTARQRPLGRVLRSAEVEHLRGAEAAVVSANATIAQRRAETDQSLEEERRRIMQDTLLEAKADASRRLATVAIAAQRSLNGLADELAIAIAEGVARVVGSLDVREAVARAAGLALRDLTDRHRIIVKVTPLAVEETRQHVKDLGETADVVADPALPADGCIIETPTGYIRATLSEQLAALRAALREAAARG